MEFPVIRTSKLTSVKSEFRTTMPLDLIEEFQLKETVINSKELSLYKILKHPNFLIIAPHDLSRNEIININKFFNTSESVQKLTDMTMYVNVSTNHYAMKLDKKISDYLKLEANKLLSYAILEVEDKKYLIISGDAKIYAE